MVPQFITYIYEYIILIYFSYVKSSHIMNVDQGKVNQNAYINSRSKEGKP